MKFSFIWMEIQLAIHSKGLKLNNCVCFFFALMGLILCVCMVSHGCMDVRFLNSFQVHMQMGIRVELFS